MSETVNTTIIVGKRGSGKTYYACQKIPSNIPLNVCVDNKYDQHYWEFYLQRKFMKVMVQRNPFLITDEKYTLIFDCCSKKFWSTEEAKKMFMSAYRGNNNIIICTLDLYIIPIEIRHKFIIVQNVS